jgi:cystathionine beta-lyase family protein involved in aluminum resistance
MLNRFTISDRNTIVTALKLLPAELEESSKLYSVLESVEQQDERLPGLNRVDEIKALLTTIEDLRAQLHDAQSNPEVAYSNAGIGRYTLDRVYTVEFSGESGTVGAIETVLAKKLEELMAYLGMPWDEDVLPIMWA